MQIALLSKLYPWLLPVIVTILLALSLVVGERVRSNTLEGKFNRIQLGMDQERVYEILGPGMKIDTMYGSFTLEDWRFEDRVIGVMFYKRQVYMKAVHDPKVQYPPFGADPAPWRHE